ncbi:MAG TPA: DUF2934 domain-containing protein [Opitutus sp.]|nr:DUF2934 domain-containing protein [Opitutus sp.]
MKSSPTVGASPLALTREIEHAPLGREAFPDMNSGDRAPREEILHRAYAIWESEGRPDNRALANWLEAETEVMGRT